jgi:hypothetical protein
MPVDPPMPMRWQQSRFGKIMRDSHEPRALAPRPHVKPIDIGDCCEQVTSMTKYLWAVLTNAEDGADAGFNRWYDDVHLPDLLRVPGIVAAQRYKLADVQTKRVDGRTVVVAAQDAALQHQYLAVYEIETDDLSAVLQAVSDRAGTPQMRMTDTLKPDASPMCFELITPAKADVQT